MGTIIKEKIKKWLEDKKAVGNAKISRIMNNKKAIEIEVLTWWIIAIAVLVLVIVGYLILKGKGISAIEFIKNLLRFGN